MGIPTPTIPSFTDGQIVHATDLNALASNLTNLYLYNNAGFTTQKPCAIVKQTSGQSIPNNADTVVNFQSAVINTDNMWTASVPGQLTIQHAGIYLLNGQVFYQAIGSPTLATNMGGYICVNGTTSSTNAVGAGGTNAGQGAAGPTANMAALVNLAAGATVFLEATQTTGASQTLRTNFGGSFLAAIFITPST
ncbi:hypothetical protein [Amycolatopsis vancoresmycina]|uniref:C1q domain-containing protein n=1 Tax=Amycolatopsis vancoresmycina DSM 44592 TaxID=1292037 RepID=R1G642_9PSEU|nr:hypothetical protein [Amycolatopsis vancoresmycina]EOD66913.1 hypothetical protein H480_19358 [Amycolatopsis vancoresmycina DSM 44592]